ncbi:Hypothetical protein NAEGRDRAFT_72760 [Naegleria gruberi]|uniref:F-box domain-containing protein n=1 Tax=Naegleria gruberi TaxID=5762 RepID=D2VUR8_NAEGR|nr:uncharacterized protein NAEGRDRAFT_72760 [Naegleria gruberi]EFC39502.1 Hypothetical protein NAEGRDRAFT_72760 [Naegleria gruberi]|eukprot:XP_002672246.1 Hypothetical protein NAEGRDRAFT_72760 [Naegleria gruberi strain NEG-M]
MLPQQESLHEQEEVNSNSIMEDAIVEAFENDDDYITDPTVNIDNFDTLSLSSLSSLVIGSNKSHHDSMTGSSSLLEEHHELLLNSSRNIIANSFNELPNEILVHILIYLNGAQIIKLECLSKRFYQLIHHEDESERNYNKKIRRGRIPSKEKRKHQRRLSINLANMIASSGLDLNSITSGYEFWMFLNEVHFRDETQKRRRDYSSAIQPRIFYMYQLRVQWLNEKYNLEKAIRSLEDEITSHSYFNEVCIFSPHLLYLQYLLFLLDRDYAAMDLRFHAFNELNLNIDTHVKPLINHILHSIYDNSDSKLSMVAIVNLASPDIIKRPITSSSVHGITQESQAQQLLEEAYAHDFKDRQDVGMIKFIHEMHFNNPITTSTSMSNRTLSKVDNEKVQSSLNTIYAKWFKKWGEIIKTKPEYSSLNYYNTRQIETIQIKSGFTYDNLLRCANGWLKREYVYARLLKKELQ